MPHTIVDLLPWQIVPAAYAVLPPVMSSPEATAFLIAIALQESKCQHRRQVNGPARGFWQFERGGVAGVRSHRATREHINRARRALCYPHGPTIEADLAALEHNDIFACVFARLLLYTLPQALPGPDEVEAAWQQYLSAWRPGKQHPETWATHYGRAWRVLSAETTT